MASDNNVTLEKTKSKFATNKSFLNKSQVSSTSKQKNLEKSANNSLNNSKIMNNSMNNNKNNNNNSFFKIDDEL